MSKEKNIDQFNKDASSNGGYLYSVTKRLSCLLSNERQSKEILRACKDLKNSNIIDMGCGDGTYTAEFLNYHPKSILGIDPAENAINKAKKRFAKNKKISFQAKDIYSLDSLNRHFDIAIIRGVLHHLYQLEKAIEQISHIADYVVILEPNGMNPILKLIEKISPYHQAHEEKSYWPPELNRLINKYHGQIVFKSYSNIVPFFCPDFLAKGLKKIEPFVEEIPLVKQLLCSTYVIAYKLPSPKKVHKSKK